jgi:hypothetical protein
MAIFFDCATFASSERCVVIIQRTSILSQTRALLENEAVWFSKLHILALFVSVATVYSIGKKLTWQWEVQK